MKLYGLYKQSMGTYRGSREPGIIINGRTEGDVEGVMDRPVGNTTDVYAECEKWYQPNPILSTIQQLIK